MLVEVRDERIYQNFYKGKDFEVYEFQASSRMKASEEGVGLKGPGF